MKHSNNFFQYQTVINKKPGKFVFCQRQVFNFEGSRLVYFLSIFVYNLKYFLFFVSCQKVCLARKKKHFFCLALLLLYFNCLCRTFVTKEANDNFSKQTAEKKKKTKEIIFLQIIFLMIAHVDYIHIIYIIYTTQCQNRTNKN